MVNGSGSGSPHNREAGFKTWKNRVTRRFSWLKVGTSCAACRICKRAGMTDIWGRGKVAVSSLMHTRGYRLERHRQSQGHSLAARGGASPSAAQVRDLLNLVTSKGVAAGRHGVTGIGGRKTCSRIIRLAGESLKILDQKMLKTVRSMSLLRDARDGRLSVRFVAVVGPKKDVHRGALGSERLVGSTAKDVLKATNKIIKRFCTRYSSYPKHATEIRSLRKRIRLMTHVMVSDAASDEMLAAEMGRKVFFKGATRRNRNKLTPNCKVVVRDKAHACRRVLKRPLTKIPSIQKVISAFITGKKSPCQIIRNSSQFRAWYRSNLKKRGFRWASLRAAKHRFESYSAPLSRICRGWRPFLRTLIHIAAKRRSPAIRKCLTKLHEHDVVLLAMTADFSHICMKFLRTFDVELVDPAITEEAMTSFLAELLRMFGPSSPACFTDTSCYTFMMCQHLKIREVWILGKTKHSLGGCGSPHQHAKDSCLDIIRGAVRLCGANLKAEFPCFDLPRAFSVFNLREEGPGKYLKNHIARLALYSGCSGASLLKEYRSVMPSALAYKFSNSCTNAAAWREMVNTWELPLPNLCTVVDRYIGFCMSTSGVEQGFAKGLHSFKLSQSRSSPEYEEITLKIALDLTSRPEYLENVVRLVRRSWSRFYGVPRKPRKSSQVDGRAPKRKREPDPPSTPEKLLRHIDALEVEDWEAAHDHELAFTAKKRKTRCFEKVRVRLLANADVDGILTFLN